MESFLLRGEDDVRALREFRRQLRVHQTIVDFEEQILLVSVRSVTRIWELDGRIAGFCFVDDYANLWFETGDGFGARTELEDEMVAWGVTCLKSQTPEEGVELSLDCVCEAGDQLRAEALRRNGFVPGSVRSLQFFRSLDEPIPEFPLPAGFILRCVRGEDEVERLVELHRAAFGTGDMSVEYRLAMMHAPHYRRDLDLVVAAPDGGLAAFCVCGLDEMAGTTDPAGYRTPGGSLLPGLKIGTTDPAGSALPGIYSGTMDPVGTHPAYQRMGLGKAVISAGLMALKQAGTGAARLGTSSENVAMQNLARACGFVCIAEKLWFSKAI